jgi:hypothetical protein
MSTFIRSRIRQKYWADIVEINSLLDPWLSSQELSVKAQLHPNRRMFGE